MARFKESYNSLRTPSAISRKPAKIFTSSGSSKTVTKVSGFTISVSLESTGLMQKALMEASSSGVTPPSITYTIAVRITGSSEEFKNCTHCTAESALWSNCPGRYSTPNTAAPSAASKLSLYKTSTGGSLNTVLHACSKVSSVIFSTS